MWGSIKMFILNSRTRIGYQNVIERERYISVAKPFGLLGDHNSVTGAGIW